MIAVNPLAVQSVSMSLAGSMSPAGQGDSQELLRNVDVKTFHQVRDLNVRRDGANVVLTGLSASYYVKQLATRAILDVVPDADVENAIAVRPQPGAVIND